MIDEEKNEIKTKQDYWVVKGNALIQQSRFSLSLIEQKTVAYICSMIKPATVETRSKICPDSPWQLDYTFDIQTYCKICGIDWDNGGNYAYIKKRYNSSVIRVCGYPCLTVQKFLLVG